MKRVPVQDVFCLAVPKGVQTDDPQVKDWLERIAQRTTMQQYQGRQVALEWGGADWLITSKPEDVEAFQPAHDCAACRAGNDQAEAFLREHPDRMIALANISYTELWP